MSSKKYFTKLTSVLIVTVTFLCSATINGQTDEQSQDQNQKKERKAKSSFKIAAGVDFNQLNLESNNPLETKSGVGYNLGLSYKRGRFFYYEIGGRYNYRKFDLIDNSEANGRGSFSVSAIEVPLTVGLNLTSYVDRLVGLRVFGSAVPAFTIGQDVDDVLYNEDQIKDFVFYGQLGIGVDVTVIFIETGFNFGLNSIVDTQGMAEPNQFFVNLGFRF